MARPLAFGLRAIFGLAGLLLIVAGAWYLQRHLVGDLHSDQDHALDLLSEGGQEPEALPGWGHVTLGAPSGAAPRPRAIELAPSPVVEEPARPLAEPPAHSAPLTLPRWPEDVELVVRDGQSLSKIAAAEYGRATEELVSLLATYNGLSNPDKLRAGQTLRLPVKEKLLAPR